MCGISLQPVSMCLIISCTQRLSTVPVYFNSLCTNSEVNGLKTWFVTKRENTRDKIYKQWDVSPKTTEFSCRIILQMFQRSDSRSQVYNLKNANQKMNERKKALDLLEYVFSRISESCGKESIG